MLDIIFAYEHLVMDEIENIVERNSLKYGDIKIIGEAIDILKDLYTIEAMRSDAYRYKGRHRNVKDDESET